MRMRRTALALAAVIATTAGVAVTAVAPAEATTLVFASPSGTGSTCTAAAPCSLATAANFAGSPVIELAGGVYQLTSTITISHTTAIKAESGANPEIVAGSGVTPAFDVVSPTLMTGLTFENPNGDGADVDVDLTAGAVLVEDSTFTNFSGGFPFFCNGSDGIDVTTSGSTLLVTDSTVVDSTDGIDLASSGASARVSGSSFTGNCDAISDNGGPATVLDSTFTADQTGIVNESSAAVTVTRMTSTDDSYALFNGSSGSMSVTDSTLTGMGTDGVHNQSSGTVAVLDSTITGAAETGVYNSAGGTIQVYGSTVTGNNWGIGGGGETLGADIVAGNTSDDCTAVPTDNGYDIDSDGTCALTGTGSVSHSASIAGSLGALTDNGGPTQTEALSADSPAVRLVTGNLSDSTRICGTPDQRGDPRPAAACDAGAYETGDPPPTPTVNLTASPAGGAPVGQTVTLTATVSGSGATPTGTVAFTADGNTLTGCGAVTLVSGAASCSTSSLTAGSYTLKGAYSGADGLYLPAADEIQGYPVIADPSITATLSSSAGKSTYGWYRTPVTVTFHCTDGTAALVAPGCPDAVTLSASKKNQSVKETITARDGGTATVHVTGIDIDRTKPTVKVTGAKNGHTYTHVRTLKCVATDSLSGVASCKIKKHEKASHGITTVAYTATATDKAGNTATATGTYQIK